MLAAGFVVYVHFHIGGPENVAGALEFNAYGVAFVIDQGVPGFEFQRDQSLFHFGQEAFDQGAVAGEAYF